MPRTAGLIPRTALLFCLASCFALRGQTIADGQRGVKQYTYTGNVGDSRVGMTLTYNNGRPRDGYYFYGKYLRDIPLSTQPQPGGVKLTEANGALDLHYKGNGSEGSSPLNEYNSVALDGTWTGRDGSTTLPVHFGLESVWSGIRERRYGDLTDETDAGYEKRVQNFCRAVLAVDRDAAMTFISYPLRVNGPKHTRFYRTPSALRGAWDQVFTPALLSRLRDDLPHDMFVRNGAAMLGRGEIWFDGKGVTGINVPPPAR